MKQIPAGAFKARCLAVMKESSNDRRTDYRNQARSAGRQGRTCRTCRVGEERHLRIHGGRSQNRGRYRVSDPG